MRLTHTAQSRSWSHVSVFCFFGSPLDPFPQPFVFLFPIIVQEIFYKQLQSSRMTLRRVDSCTTGDGITVHSV